jgi:hypothetical protein
LTFTSLSPLLAWLLVAAAAAVAAAVFVIRPRPAEQVIPSLLIWRRVFDEKRGLTLWERVRWVVSLLLTIVIGVSIVAAVLKPAPRSSGRAAGRALLVLDSSWSMRARTTAGSTRWDRAVQAARSVAESAAGSEIAIATTGEGVIEGPTADLALIQSALERLAPSGAADGAWPRIAGAQTVHFFTDGRRQ